MLLLSCCTFLPPASLTGLWLEKEEFFIFTIISVETGFPGGYGMGWRRPSAQCHGKQTWLGKEGRGPVRLCLCQLHGV